MKLHVVVLGWLLVGPIGTLAAFLAVRSVVRGEYLSAIVAVGACAFCFGLIIPTAKVVRGKVNPRADFDDVGTTIRPDRSIDIPIRLSLVGGVVACALLTILVPLGKLDMPVPASMRYSLPFMSAAVVAMGAPLVWRHFRRGSTKLLRLAPNGFHFVEGRRPQSGEWGQVADVTDSVPGQQAPAPGTVVVVLSNGRTASLAAGSMTPEGRALREWVRFYWQHPGRRGELTDGGALRRLSEEQFDVDGK